MNPSTRPIHSIFENLLPWLVLAILLFFTHAKFLEHWDGFRWSSTGSILYVFVDRPDPTLKVGDQLVQIGPMSWDEFSSDLRRTFFQGVQADQIVDIVVERDGQQVTIPWQYPQYNRREFLDRLYSEWWLAYFFWLAGTFTSLLIRPRDIRWRLMVAFNFLTAIWLSAGSGPSSAHIGNSAIILRSVVILCLPVYLHLHWEFPQPLGRLPSGFVWSVYGVAVALAFAQWFQWIPSDLYFLTFMVAIMGSAILLLLHILFQRSARHDLRIVLVVVLLAALPLIVSQIIYYFFPTLSLNIGGVALLSLPFFPLAYMYAAFRRRLVNMEVRLHHAFSIYLFLILLVVVVVPLILVAENQLNIPQKTLLVATGSTALTAAAFIWLYPMFQHYIESRVLGIPSQSLQLQADYSAHIARSKSLSDLAHILGDNIFPGLLIRQFAFLYLDGDSLNILAAENVIDDHIPTRKSIRSLLNNAGQYRPPDTPTEDQFHWIRLTLTLQAGDELIGFWLLGQRDPDDLYHYPEILLLQSLANQTAIGINNILQTGRIRNLYAGYINRHEEERRQLARELHDGVLNQMAAWLMNQGALVPQSHHNVQDELVLIRQLRQIVTNLRPPMLSYGLKLAIEELADALMERNHKVDIRVAIEGAEKNYGTDVEQHIYRIIQEACENALRHGKSTDITISGRFESNSMDLFIEDNGIGFSTQEELGLDNLILEKHFGLAGMLERAMMINADLKINSIPGKGAQIHIKWRSGLKKYS